jgi:hypothetical protein
MPRSQKTGTILKLHFELHSNKYIFSQKFVLRQISYVRHSTTSTVFGKFEESASYHTMICQVVEYISWHCISDI